MSAKKMILVPYDEFMDLKNRILARFRNAEVDRTVNLEERLKTENAKIPDDLGYRSRQSLYSDYINQIRKHGTNSAEPNLPTQTTDGTPLLQAKTDHVTEISMQHPPDLVYGELLSHIPQRNYNRFARVIDAIRQRPDVIKTNPDKTVSIHGNGIPGSNVDDLLHKALNKNVKDEPVGYAQFMAAMAEIGVGLYNIQDKTGQKSVANIRLKRTSPSPKQLSYSVTLSPRRLRKRPLKADQKVTTSWQPY